jgi:transcriptional regulator with XRE-family HTH domain
MNYALKLAILKSRRNQVDIAREVRIFESRLSKIVNGYIEPSWDEKGRIAEVLGQKPEELFEKDEIHNVG